MTYFSCFTPIARLLARMRDFCQALAPSDPGGLDFTYNINYVFKSLTKHKEAVVHLFKG